MSFYHSIRGVGAPADIGLDSANRIMFSSNYSAEGNLPIAALEREIVKLIVVAGLAIDSGAGQNIWWAGSKTTIPAGNGPFILIFDYGGPGPVRSHDGYRVERRSFSVIVRGASYDLTHDRALAIYRLLDAVTNRVIE